MVPQTDTSGQAAAITATLARITGAVGTALLDTGDPPSRRFHEVREKC